MFDSHRSPLPPLVVVPTSAGHEPDRRVELWEDHDGRLVLFCYSDVEVLHRLYRADCPWARLDHHQVATVREQVEVLLLDVAPAVAPPATAPVVPGQRRA
ncbi:hypothetical protein [Nocardioides aurantiacus]|uniref:hypothetical protein n=1 Tax=Nocardioides aurantiacus TaxID=86796 RepID=UPI00403F4F64